MMRKKANSIQGNPWQIDLIQIEYNVSSTELFDEIDKEINALKSELLNTAISQTSLQVLTSFRFYNKFLMLQESSEPNALSLLQQNYEYLVNTQQQSMAVISTDFDNILKAQQKSLASLLEVQRLNTNYFSKTQQTIISLSRQHDYDCLTTQQSLASLFESQQKLMETFFAAQQKRFASLLEMQQQNLDHFVNTQRQIVGSLLETQQKYLGNQQQI